MNIQLRTIGEISSGGDDDEKYILIMDDIENTGGYYIYLCQSINMNNCYDMWVLDEKELKANTACFIIKWLDKQRLPEWCLVQHPIKKM